MATVASTGDAERAVFVRKATGLVRGWSTRDAFIYAAFSINLITLGLWIFGYAPFIPEGSMLWAVLLAGFYLVVQGITYASLIAAMPRAGGDYVWISRVLGGGPGFVLAVTGWWFILWLWVPIYANILNVEVIGPLAAIIGWEWGYTFWSGDDGIFVSSAITALLASAFISMGMRRYARFQKICFYGGLVGLGIMMLLLLFNSKESFITNFNEQSLDLYGVENAYEATLAAGTDGFTPSGLGSFAFGATLLLIPMMAFFNLWSYWGATLYGEVRGASDFRQNIAAMAGALLATTVAAVVLFLLFSKTFGWDWYNAANNAYWAGTIPTGVWPYPGLLGGLVPRQPGAAVPPHRGPLAVVLRLGGDRVPVVDAGDLRRGVRPGAARGRLQGRPQRRPVRGAAAHAHPGHRRRRAVRLQRGLPDLHAGRHARDRGDVPGVGDRRRGAAVAAA